MSHVDEGRLHALLDGALDDEAPSEAAAVRAHLDSCTACAARLEEARALREASDAILAGALPEPGPLPDLETLRAEARHRQGTGSRRRRLVRLAWAASVVISLGAGWVAREVTGPGGTAPAEATREAMEEDAAAGADAIRPAVGRPAGETSAAESVATANQGGATAPAARAVEEEERSRVPERPVRAVRDTTFRADPAPEPSADPASGAPGDAGAPPAAELARPAQASARRAGAADLAQPSTYLDEAAAAPAGVPMGVPDLPVVSVSRVPDVARGSGVRILHALPGGDILEVIHLLDGADPSSLPVLEAGRTELVLPGPSGDWLVLRADRTEEELRAWADRVGR